MTTEAGQEKKARLGERDDYLRVVGRTPSHQRFSFFLPLNRDRISADMVAGLEAAYPRLTVYTFNEAERMVLAGKRVKGLVEAAEETLCDDTPCARCDNLRAALSAYKQEVDRG